MKQITLFLMLFGGQFIYAQQPQQFQAQPQQQFQAQPQQQFGQTTQQQQPQQSSGLAGFGSPVLMQGYRFGSFSPYAGIAPSVMQSPQIQTLQSNTQIKLPTINIRTKVKIEIEYKKVNLVELRDKLYNRISRILINKNDYHVAIDIQGRNAIITGSVGSDEDLYLIQGLIALEPGIDNIIDHLTISK